MHFWKGAKFAGSVAGFQLLGGFAPLTPWTSLGALPPDPRYRLVLRTRRGAPPQPLTPSAAYDHPGKNPAGAPDNFINMEK